MPIPRAGQLDRLRQLASQTPQSNQQTAANVRTARPAYAHGAQAYAVAPTATPTSATASPDRVTISAEARQLADNVLRLVRAQPSPTPAALRPNSHQKRQAQRVYDQTAQFADMSQPHVLITMAEPPEPGIEPAQARQGASWLV